MTDFNPPNAGKIDQAVAALRDMHPPLFASIFRAFCAEEGVTRTEALALTVNYMTAAMPYIMGARR